MVFAELIDFLEEHSAAIIPLVALLLIVAIPPLRRSILQAFQSGKERGEQTRRRWQGKEGRTTREARDDSE